MGVICDGSNKVCCSSVSVTSSGGVANLFSEVLGKYTKTTSTKAGQPVYSKGNLYLYYLEDVQHHFEGWTISESLSDVGSVIKVEDTDCPDDKDGDWEYLNQNTWVVDSTLSVDCA